MWYTACFLLLWSNAFELPDLHSFFDNQSPCVQSITRIASNFNQSEPMALNAALYSSHGLNDLGNYDSCSNTTTNRYILLKMRFNPSLPSYANLAFCGPIECKSEDYNVLKPTIFGLIKQMFEKDNVPLVSGTLNATVDNLVFVDPQERMPITMKLSTGFYISISIYAILIIIAIVATIIDWHKDPKEPSEGILMYWSACRNCKSLFYSKNPLDANLDALNGVRLLMMVWIIIGHTFEFTLAGPVPNVDDTTDIIKNSLGITFITSAHFSVDVFFTLSGFLCTISMMKTFSDPKNRNAKMVILSIVGRFMRLLPLVGFAMITYLTILPVLFKSPINNFWDDVRSICRKFYLTLLFVNNFAKSGDSCMDWTWFLANDMQFFWVTPLFVIPYLAYGQHIGFLSILGVSVASFIVQAILIVKYNFSQAEFRASTENYFDSFFIRPYTIIIVYLIGMIVGWMYLSFKDKKYRNRALDKITSAFQNYKAFRDIMYVLALGAMLFLILINHYFDKNYLTTGHLSNCLYLLGGRPIFIAATWCIIYPLIIGKGRALFALLAAPFMGPLAKLTYGAYLIHIPFILTEIFTIHNYIFFDPLMCLIRSFHVILMAYVWSLLASLIVEAPLMKIERMLLSPRKREKAIETPDNEVITLREIEKPEESEQTPKIESK